MTVDYLLTVVFTNGEQKEICLDQPHLLQPAPDRPHALTYTDRDGLLHNLPWSGIREFYFSPEEYNRLVASRKTNDNGRL